MLLSPQFSPASPRRTSARALAALFLAAASLLGLPDEAFAQFAAAATTPGAMPTLQATTAPGTEPDNLAVPAPLKVRPSAEPSVATGTPAVLGAAAQPAPPNEFERYVQQQVGASDADAPRRLGYRLLTDPAVYGAALDPLAVVPGDYIVKQGDEIVVTLWGSANADLRLVVDRAGMISVPRVGAIPVAGLRADALQDAIARQVGQVYRNFHVAASVGQVRPMRVYVAGYAERPGALTVSGLASVLHVVMRAGGPSGGGSFRDIHLRRGGRDVATFDLYDLLVRGDRAADQLVQPDDVIYIGPAGPQVALVGSVNRPAVFELKPGETLDDVLQMAGGFDSVADRNHLTIEPLDKRTKGRVEAVNYPQDGGMHPGAGDLIRVGSAVSAILPLGNQNKRVRVEGEVLHPGDYVLPPNSTLQDAIQRAGGLSPLAFLYGTELYRESVRRTQEANYERALQQLEGTMVRTQGTQRVTSTQDAANQEVQRASNERLLQQLRSVHPTGRMLLQVDPAHPALPALSLEDGDRLYIPSTPDSVGVFGSVFTTASFVYSPDHTLGSYLAQAGGPTRGADRKSIFVIHANGSVQSAQQEAGFWTGGDEGILQMTALPGDTIFVPEEMNKSTFIQDAKDWTQVLYQFGLGLAGIKVLGL